MPPPTALKPVAAQPGKPLYQTVREAIRQAIDDGVLKPEDQLPSTKELSDQLEVSLVTAHRALQELVTAGVLYRAQGKGTFVNPRYIERGGAPTVYRVGLVFRDGASLADYYHSQLLEGVYQAATRQGIDFVLLRFGEDARNECNAYLHVNPLPEEMERLLARATRRQPVLVVGAASSVKGLPSLDVDNVDVAAQAVNHLADLGHRRIAYLGGPDELANNRDRWRGFQQTCVARNIEIDPSIVIKSTAPRLDQRDNAALAKILSPQNRPSAIFCAGYFHALAAYSAAAGLNLKIPANLSVVAVDDPPSAAYLAPPLTTVRQPVTQLGQLAVEELYQYLHHQGDELPTKTLKADLVPRASSAPPRPAA